MPNDQQSVTFSFVSRHVLPGKFLLHPMDLANCLADTGSCSMPRQISYNQDLYDNQTMSHS